MAIILVLFAHISTHTCDKLSGVYLIGSLKWASTALLVDIGVIDFLFLWLRLGYVVLGYYLFNKKFNLSNSKLSI